MSDSSLATTDKLLRLIIDAIPSCICVKDRQGRYQLVNKAAGDLYSLSPEEMLGRTDQDLSQACSFQPGDVKNNLQLDRHAIESGLATLIPEEAFTCSNGTRRWFHTTTIPLDTEEYTGCLLGIREDITDRKTALEEAPDNNPGLALFKRISAAIEQFDECVVFTDVTGTIEYVNPAFERLTGYCRAEVIGNNPRLLQSGKHSSAFYRDLWTTISSGQVWRGRIVNRKKDGSYIKVEATITPLMDDSGKIVNYVAVARDVTRQEALEQQYRQAQRMEAVGQLTAGLAHDFNNLLTAINGFSELLRNNLPADSQSWHMAGLILDSGQRAADLIGQLLTFSRKQIIAPRTIYLNDVVNDAHLLLRLTLDEGIDMEKDLDPELWPVHVDPGQIDQILLNLVANARDAMPDGGTLTIQTRNVVPDDVLVAEHPESREGEYVALSVSDTGFGMTEEVRARIFEPFFTTKEVGRGPGLGLSVVYGIVRQNNGYILVDSQEGQGSTVNVYLPRQVPLGTVVETTIRRMGMPTGSETLLLIEDNQEVRELAQHVLEGLDYTVLVANNGEMGLQFLSNYDGRVHLILTDVVMPGISGKALADQLTMKWPDIKVLFMSGYTGETVTRWGIVPRDTAFLEKPFSPMALARKVREVLDRRSDTIDEIV